MERWLRNILRFTRKSDFDFMNYFKILTFLEKGNKFLFDIPVEEQKKYLKKLGKAKNDIDRSYKQYLCQMLFVPNWKVYLFDIIAIFLFPIYLLVFLAKGWIIKPKFRYQVDCICEDRKMPEILPDTFRKEYHISFKEWGHRKYLCSKDVLFILKCFIQTWSPYMVFKCAVKISEFSYMIHSYRPRAIQECGEYSFTSSLLTAYCNDYGVKHINVMHGEKLFYIRDAYFHYDETYIWHEHYKKLFLSMNAEPSQFIVDVPPSLKIDSSKYSKIAFADYKYYLAGFSEEQIKGVVDSMTFARKEGKRVVYRPHPRYSDLELLRKYVKEEYIEIPGNVDIITSIASADYIVGSFTTVLTQAFLSGKKILLDDMTFKDQYEKVKGMAYFLSSVDANVLSKKQQIWKE